MIGEVVNAAMPYYPSPEPDERAIPAVIQFCREMRENELTIIARHGLGSEQQVDFAVVGLIVDRMVDKIPGARAAVLADICALRPKRGHSIDVEGHCNMGCF